MHNLPIIIRDRWKWQSKCFGGVCDVSTTCNWYGPSWHLINIIRNSSTYFSPCHWSSAAQGDNGSYVHDLKARETSTFMAFRTHTAGSWLLNALHLYILLARYLDSLESFLQNFSTSSHLFEQEVSSRAPLNGTKKRLSECLCCCPLRPLLSSVCSTWKVCCLEINGQQRSCIETPILCRIENSHFPPWPC